MVTAARPVGRVFIPKAKRETASPWHTRRLRQRIFAATAAGHYKRARSLQRPMLRSRSNAQISVRQVTERNARETSRP